jgi:hypothetical protein
MSNIIANSVLKKVAEIRCSSKGGARTTYRREWDRNVFTAPQAI